METYLIWLFLIGCMFVGTLLATELIVKYCRYVVIRLLMVTIWPVAVIFGIVLAIILFTIKGLPENW